MLVGPLAFACAHHLEASMVPDEIVPYTTDDGWTNELRRYRGDGEAVVLVHGMGANHYNWDFREEVSYADHLRDLGWDVWVVGLRGDPRSTAPRRGARKEFTFDDHATLDVPAALAVVRGATGEDRVHWVGHSMGGMLLYSTLAIAPEWIEAGVAVASPATLQVRNAQRRLALGTAFLSWGPGLLRVRAIERLTRPLGRHNPLFSSIANPDNLDWPTANGMARVALVDLPKPMARQTNAWLRAREFVDTHGEPWVRPVDIPILVIGGSIDKVVPADDAAAACAIYPDCTYRLLGTQTGASVDYGHVDLVIGTTAPSEVWPVIDVFLAEAHS